MHLSQNKFTRVAPGQFGCTPDSWLAEKKNIRSAWFLDVVVELSMY
jgi:hypothetical protein